MFFYGEYSALIVRDIQAKGFGDQFRSRPQQTSKSKSHYAKSIHCGHCLEKGHSKNACLLLKKLKPLAFNGASSPEHLHLQL